MMKLTYNKLSQQHSGRKLLLYKNSHIKLSTTVYDNAV